MLSVKIKNNVWNTSIYMIRYGYRIKKKNNIVIFGKKKTSSS